MISARLRSCWVCAACILLVTATLNCSRPEASATPDPRAGLRNIPEPDLAQSARIEDMKQWRNPYLIVRPDGVALYDSADSAQIILKPDEVLAALAKLPSSSWPYGRVVAAAEVGTRASEQDGVAIRRNKGIVGGMLEEARVAIQWVPAR